MGQILSMEYQFGLLYVRSYKSLSTKNKRLETGLHLNNRQICPRKLQTLVHVIMKDTPTLALKRGPVCISGLRVVVMLSIVILSVWPYKGPV